MAAPNLSVVIPVHNEAAHLPATIDALVEAVARSGFEAELVLVDDGSTDGSGEIATQSLRNRIPVRVLRQENRGRLGARWAGLDAASGQVVLLLDGRVRLAPNALRFVGERIELGDRVWTAHVHVDADSLFGVFWSLLAELAWREYFDNPRTTSFGIEDFDRFPKGTTCFLAPRDVLLETFGRYTSRYANPRHANDDTPVLRDLAVRQRIHVSPHFACTYTPRGTLDAFFRHAIHRGVVFLDGHGRADSRFFPVSAAFFPLSTALAVAALRRPLLLPATAALCGLGAFTYGLRAGRNQHELQALALVTPIYAVGHGIGMWKGLAMLAHARFARGDQA